MKFNGSVITGQKVILTKPVNGSSVDLAHLKGFKPENKNLLLLYKRFYRLRNLIGNYHEIQRYQELLRWKFSREDFNIRRQRVLKKPDTLTDENLWDRLLNTLTFVHNSTVILPEAVEDKPVLFYGDFKTPERLEKLVIQTLLTMQHQKPHEIAYDYKYNWYDDIERRYNELPEVPTKKQFQEMLPEPSYIGFRDYELNLMILNEMYNLCL